MKIKTIVDMPEKKKFIPNKGFVGLSSSDYGYNQALKEIGNLEVNENRFREEGWVKVMGCLKGSPELFPKIVMVLKEIDKRNEDASSYSNYAVGITNLIKELGYIKLSEINNCLTKIIDTLRDYEYYLSDGYYYYGDDETIEEVAKAIAKNIKTMLKGGT